MKPRILIVATAVTTLLLSASLAFGQAADTRDNQSAGQTTRQRGGATERMNVPADKRESVNKIKDEYKDRIANLRQQIRSKYQELETAMSQAQPDANRAKSAAKDLANLKNQLMDLLIDRNVRITQETGVKMPLGAWKEGRSDMMDDSAAPAKKARKAKSRSTYRDDNGAMDRNGTMYRDPGRGAPSTRDTMGRDTMGRDTMTRPDTTRDSTLPSPAPRDGQGRSGETGSEYRRGVIDR